MTTMKNRVRGILIKDRERILLIKRVRPGSEPYWVFPGGGLENTDESLEAALGREILEELAGAISIKKLVKVREVQSNDGIVIESFFLCDVLAYDFSQKTGPEFADSERGEYVLQEIPLRPDTISDLNILPAELKIFLLENVDKLYSLPDLRH
jgi:ADP-ribose pyrophosphatase YjhB (NUDIX family)